MQTQLPKTQHKKTYKAHFDKPHKQKTLCFAEDTKTEADRKESVNEIEDNSNNKTEYEDTYIDSSDLKPTTDYSDF